LHVAQQACAAEVRCVMLLIERNPAEMSLPAVRG
jgi:hypothetical protein